MIMDRYPLLALAGALLISVALGGPVRAAGGGDGSGDGGGDGGGGGRGDTSPFESGAANEAYKAGMAAVDAKNWDVAITNFTAATTAEPGNADGYNMLAYSLRNSGDYDQAFYYYDKALAIDPNHTNAHEYVGEAYLAVDDLAKAEEHLAALDDICWLGCEQYYDLKEAVETYKANQ
jgi:tetratricopeptide (TPR) repeat protein